MKPKLIQEEIKSLDDAQRIFEEGIQCTAPIEVGEAVDATLAVFNNLEGTSMMKDMRMRLWPSQQEDLNHFLMLLAVSITMTMVGNFQERESGTVGES